MASLSDREYIKQWREKSRDAARSHLMADVSVGVFLGGGIDSSAIGAMIGNPVNSTFKTFSVAFSEREANELERVLTIAKVDYLVPLPLFRCTSVNHA